MTALIMAKGTHVYNSLCVVPREPTEAMIEAGSNCGDWGPGIACDETDAGPENCYRAMVAAV